MIIVIIEKQVFYLKILQINKLNNKISNLLNIFFSVLVDNVLACMPFMLCIFLARLVSCIALYICLI